MERQGIHMKGLFAAMFFLVAVIMSLFGAEVRKADLRVQAQAEIEHTRGLCEQESQALAEGSDYLTSETWQFVATGNVRHLDNYWQEVYKTRSRDQAVERLSTLSLTDEEWERVKSAKRFSDELIKGETWAMRLTADSMGMEPSDMPEDVAAVRYTDGEEELSEQQKRQLASQYIFGREYASCKEIIRADIQAFQRLLRQRMTRELSEAAEKTQESIYTVHVLTLLVILSFAVDAALIYGLLIRPFSHYTRLLRQTEGFTRLTPTGAWETRTFAKTFNQIYAAWQEEKARLEKERYRFHMALDNAAVIVYEYDFASDTCTTYGTLERRDGQQEVQQERVIPRFAQEFAPRFMGEDDIERLRTALERGDFTPVEIQIYPHGRAGMALWVRITKRPIYGAGRVIEKVIGKISNIQSEKEKEFALEDAHSRDGLTGFYQRDVGICKVRAFMAQKSPEVICGLMLLDMDQFGILNEEEGQSFADAILQDVAGVIRAQTGPEDILVRLGGDELMLFVKNCPKSRATVLGPEIARQIHALSGQQGSNLQVSASIGMCVTEVVDEYDGLYRCAESSLKYVKAHGKGWAACYLDTSNEVGEQLTRLYPERHFINEINRSESLVEDLPAFALDLLGNAKNLNDAIYLLLSRVGKSCGIDRIRIIELDREYMGSHVVYQWAKSPVDLVQMGMLYITADQLQALTASFDADGLSEQRVFTDPGEMKCILFAAIWNYGNCEGTMSFERREERSWSPEERHLLSELTRVISSFTLKVRADAVSQAKTDFLSRMSHEIRTPMNAITGMTEIAKAALHNPEKLLSCLDKIDSANKYLLSLINDVLDMSRIESGKVEVHLAPLSLEKLLSNVETLIRSQAETRGLRFTIRNGCPAGCWVMGDDLRLNQVLVNLLGNAVKFTEAGGSITLELAEAGEALSFSVSDTGIGISEEAQGRIFNAFEQAESSTATNYGGTGLGLAISSRLVQLMGGALDVESTLGEGSRFFFSIPLVPASPEDCAQDSDIDEAQPLFEPHGRRLLLVEDNQMNREIAQEILEDHGFVMETASDGRQALECFQQADPGYYAAILMDIRMPVMDGMEATRRIRTLGKADSRTIPIIAMTANAFDEDMKKSLENGMNGHLSKPIDIKELLRTLQKLLGGQ